MRKEKLLDELFAVEDLGGDYGAHHAHDMERARDTCHRDQELSKRVILQPFHQLYVLAQHYFKFEGRLTIICV